MELKRYKEGDEEQILELFELVFKREMTKDEWLWRFKNNPFTEEVFIYLMWEGDQLIGHYAVSPVEMNVEGEVMKTALSMTTMTHPEYGGKGIFSKLATNLYTDLKEVHDYKLVWGFPNSNSHYGFKKNLGWKDIAVEPMLSGKVQELRLARDFTFSYSVRKAFDNHSFQQLNRSDKRVRINKTERYLKWRYIDNPGANYKILSLDGQGGMVVYKLISSFTEEGAFDVDLMEISFGADITILSGILNSIIKEEGNRIKMFNIWRSVFTEDRILFEKLGFRMTLPLTYLSYLELENISIASNYKNWEIGLGYSDVF